MLIDSHCHLEMKDFNNDRDEVIERGKKNGITYMVTIGTSLRDCQKAVNIAKSYDCIYAAIGIHPHNAKEIDESVYNGLRKLAKEDKVVALGEIGLDFFRNLSPKKIQIERFREQINLARELKLPLIIHDREAHEKILDILKQEEAKDLGGIIHCFSGDYSMARKCVDMGFYIGVSTTITYKNNHRLQDIVRKLPLDRLLVETDAPFLSPQPHRGKRNEPSYVRHGAEKISELKGIPFVEVAEVIFQNTIKILGIEKK